MRPQAPAGGCGRQLSFPWGIHWSLSAPGRNEPVSPADTPKSVWIRRTGRGVSPGVQRIPTCVHTLPSRCPSDASDLWKVRSSCDLSLTVLLCTFLCKEGRFVKKPVLHGLVPETLSRVATLGGLFFSPRGVHTWIPGSFRTALSGGRGTDGIGHRLAWLPRHFL